MLLISLSTLPNGINSICNDKVLLTALDVYDKMGCLLELNCM